MIWLDRKLPVAHLPETTACNSTKPASPSFRHKTRPTLYTLASPFASISFKMQHLLFSLSLLASAAVGTLASENLKIDVTLPVECERKTQKGDTINVHYRGTLQSNGEKFDASKSAAPESCADPLYYPTQATAPELRLTSTTRARL